MLSHRIIPCLSISNGDLIKTQNFKKRTYIGDPINAIRIFNEKEVDELMVIDIDASKYSREPNYELISRIAEECFMPLAYGGGVRTIDQAQKIYSCGVEKICLQSAALENPFIVTELAARFGSQSVMISIDVKRNWRGKFEVYSASKGVRIKKDCLEVINDLVKAGAGEIILNAIDKDGTLLGPDLELISYISNAINIPLIAVGGISSLNDIKAAVDAGASAVAAGAFFVFHGPHRAVLITYPKYQELEELFK